MLNGANPFDIVQEAQMAHFKISGIVDSFTHLLDLQTVLGFKYEKHILPLFIFTQRSSGLSEKNTTHVLQACD